MISCKLRLNYSKLLFKDQIINHDLNVFKRVLSESAIFITNNLSDTDISETVKSSVECVGKVEHLSYLNGLFKQFESSIQRSGVSKSNLLKRWSLHLNHEKIASAEDLLVKLNKTDTYKSTREYVMNNYMNFNNKELVNVTKIYKHVDVANEIPSFRLVRELDTELLKRISSFEVDELYDVYLGICSRNHRESLDTILNELTNCIKNDKFLNTATTSQISNAELDGIKSIEDKIIAYDAHNPIWVPSELIKLTRKNLDVEYKRSAYTKIVNRMYKTNKDMPDYLRANYIGLLCRNFQVVEHMKLDFVTRIEMKLSELIKEFLFNMVKHDDSIIVPNFWFHIIYQTLKYNNHMFDSLFQSLFEITRSKILNESNDYVSFFKHFSTLHTLVKSVDVLKNIKNKDMLNEIVTFKEFVKAPTMTAIKYYDDQLKRAVIDKFEEFTPKSDVLSLSEIGNIYPTVKRLYPDKEERIAIVYNHFMKAADIPKTHFIILKCLHKMSDNDSTESELKIFNKILPNISNSLSNITPFQKEMVINLLIKDKQNFLENFELAHKLIVDVLQSDEDFLKLHPLISHLKNHVTYIIERHGNGLIDLCRAMYKKVIESCVNTNLVMIEFNSFKKYFFIIFDMIVITRDVNKYLLNNYLQSNVNDLFIEATSLINYDKLLDMAKDKNLKYIDRFKHINTMKLMSYMFSIPNIYSEKCLNDMFEIYFCHLNYYLSKVNLDTYDRKNCELVFDCLKSFIYFDITKSENYLNSKQGFEKTMCKYYESIILNIIDQTERTKEIFKYVLYMLCLNCTDIAAFGDFIRNISLIKAIVREPYAISLIQKVLSTKYPRLDYTYYPQAFNLVVSDDEVAETKLYETIHELMKTLTNGESAVKIDPKYMFGLTTKYEIIFKNEYPFDCKDIEFQIIRMPVYVLNDRMSYSNSYIPKPFNALEIDCLKALKYPVLTINLREFEKQEKKAIFIFKKLMEALNKLDDFKLPKQ